MGHQGGCVKRMYEGQEVEEGGASRGVHPAVFIWAVHVRAMGAVGAVEGQGRIAAIGRAHPLVGGRGLERRPELRSQSW